MSDYEKRELLKIDLRQNTQIDTVQKKKREIIHLFKNKPS